MTDEQDPFSAELDAIAKKLPSIPSAYAELRRLLASLPEPPQPDLQVARAAPTDLAQAITQAPGLGSGGVASSLSGLPPGYESGAGIGRFAELFYGQTNALKDPAFEQWPAITAVTIGTTATAIGPHWRAWKVSNSGVDPTVTAIINLKRDDPDNNPTSSNVGRLQASATGAYDVTVFLESTSSWGPSDTNLSAIVAAVKLSSSALATGSHTARLQVVRSADSAIVAETTSIDVDSLGSAEYRRLVAAYLADPATLVANSWRLRLRMDMVSTSAGLDIISVKIAEPQIGFSASELPPPYMPIVAHWFPSTLRSRTVEMLPIDTAGVGFEGWYRLQGITGSEVALEFRTSGDANIKAAVGAMGGTFATGLRLGAGGATAPDLRLFRAAAGTMRLDTDFGATQPVSLEVVSDDGQRNAIALFTDSNAYDRLNLEGSATFTGIQMGDGGNPPDVSIFRISSGVIGVPRMQIQGAAFVGSYYTGNITAGSTHFIPDASIARQGGALIVDDGNSVVGICHYYRSGTFNVIAGLEQGGIEYRGTTFSAGAGTFSFFIEGNNAGDRLAIKNNAGFGRGFFLVPFTPA